MPVLAEIAVVVLVLDHLLVGHDQDFVQLRMPAQRHCIICVEFAKATAEGDVLFAADGLAEKQQQATRVEKGAVHLAKGSVGHRRAQVHVQHLHAQPV